MLLEARANANATTRLRNTPLFYACKEAAQPAPPAAHATWLRLVRALLAAGAQPGAANVGGELPLHWAAVSGAAAEVLDLLHQREPSLLRAATQVRAAPLACKRLVPLLSFAPVDARPAVACARARAVVFAALFWGVCAQDGLTPLIAAASKGDEDAVRFITARSPGAVRDADKQGATGTCAPRAPVRVCASTCVCVCVSAMCVCVCARLQRCTAPPRWACVAWCACWWRPVRRPPCPTVPAQRRSRWPRTPR